MGKHFCYLLVQYICARVKLESSASIFWSDPSFLTDVRHDMYLNGPVYLHEHWEIGSTKVVGNYITQETYEIGLEE